MAFIHTFGQAQISLEIIAGNLSVLVLSFAGVGKGGILKLGLWRTLAWTAVLISEC